MKLSELLPQKVTIKLSRLDKDLELNLITLSDVAWIEENYPNDEFNKIFTEIRLKDLLRFTARLLTNESKKYLGQAKIIEIDEYGNEIPVGENITLGEKLYKILNDGELMKIINAIFDIRLKSQEIAQIETEKIEKKSQAMQQLSGKQSTISSPHSTEQQLSSSVN